MFAHGETVTVLTAGTETDPYSNKPAASWDVEPTGVDVDHVGVASGGSVDLSEQARDAVDSDFDMFFPPTATVTSANRVVVRGLTCDVVGRPFLWSSPFSGWTPGLVVQVKIREG